MKKIHKKGIFSSNLDRFHNDEVFFHTNQLQHNWTKEWCEYLDYVRTIDITHNASPEQLEDTQRCIIFGTIRKTWRKAQ